MRYSTLSFGALFSIFLFACGSNETITESHINTQDSLYQAVMVIHDEVMPNNAKIIRMTQNLRVFIPEDVIMEDDKERIYQTMKQLEDAEEAMMAWMAAIKPPAKMREAGKSHRQIMKYLKAEEKAIGEVRTQMLTALEEGEQLLTEMRQKM